MADDDDDWNLEDEFDDALNTTQKAVSPVPDKDEQEELKKPVKKRKRTTRSTTAKQEEGDDESEGGSGGESSDDGKVAEEEPSSDSSDGDNDTTKPHKKKRLYVPMARADRTVFDNFTPSQQKRYHSFRHSRFPKAAIKKIIMAVSANARQPSDEIAVVLGGITKLYVGELIERARDVMVEQNKTGHIHPAYLREAYRRIHYKRLRDKQFF